MITHNHTILEIIEWAWFGVLQWIKHVVPDTILQADYVGRDPPDWYTEVKTRSSWRGATSPDGYPLDTWFSRYFEAIGLQLGLWIDEAGTWAYDASLEVLLDHLGQLASAFNTWSGWVNHIWSLTGDTLPDRWSNLCNAANDLYFLLPSNVRNRIQTWTEVLQGATDDAIEWAQSAYADTVDFALYAKNWVVGAGLIIDTWYHSVNIWLDNLMNDFYGQISDALGDAWDDLRRFARTRLEWYVDFYNHYRNDAVDFFSDPITFLYDRVEPWVLDHIW